METLKHILEFTLLEFGPYKLRIWSIISIFLIFTFARILLFAVAKVVDRRFSKDGAVNYGRSHAIIQISKYMIFIFATLLALESVGMQMTWLLASSAALMVGIGFGLQNTFNDFVSGIIILFDASIEVGDVVQVGDLVGKVKKIGLRATTIDTRDSIAVIVPNSKFTNDLVTNWSHAKKTTRFSIGVGVAYGSDVKLVMKLLYDCTLNHPLVIKDPVPKLQFADFGDSALLFNVYFFTNDTFGVEFLKSDIRVAIDAAFREHGVQIPFPQRDVHYVSDFRAK